MQNAMVLVVSLQWGTWLCALAGRENETIKEPNKALEL